MSKTLCKIKKLRKKDFGEFVQHIRRPKFVCKKCGRVADGKGLLCKPKKIK